LKASFRLAIPKLSFGNKVVEIGKKTRLCCSPVGGTERRVGDERD
jgi:hypothetical protein